MLSAVVEAKCLGGDLEIMQESFNPKVKKHYNNAPSQGLLLWNASFSKYNAKNENTVSLSEDTLKSMEGFRAQISEQVAAKHEFIEREFSYFLM